MGLLNGQTEHQYYGSEELFGKYQFTSLTDIINQFIIVYVGEDKIISKVKRTDVAFHAQRALAELSFDTFKSCKAQEITVPASLQMVLPQDYVNYTKISWVDSAGIKHLLYPTSKTSNPTNHLQNSNGDFNLEVQSTINASGEITLDDYYPQIQVGDIVSGPSIGSWPVHGNTTVAGVTTLVLGDYDAATIIANTFVASTVLPNATFPITETLSISNASGGLKFEYTSVTTPSITSAPWVVNENVITLDNASDSEGVEVGMNIEGNSGAFNFSAWPPGTTVTGVSGKYITMSQPAGAVLAPTSLSSGITFTKPLTDSDTWSNYKSSTPSENQDDYQDDTYWKMNGNRYGLDPQHAQANGSFYIDCKTGKIHFSSNISGKTVILDYISDSLGTDGEMQVHKFAEEAMYKWIAHAVLAGRANVPEYQVNRFKKERFAAIRTAKLRLSNIKLEEITQILRGKSKQIKH